MQQNDAKNVQIAPSYLCSFHSIKYLHTLLGIKCTLGHNMDAYVDFKLDDIVVLYVFLEPWWLSNGQRARIVLQQSKFESR